MTSNTQSKEFLIALARIWRLQAAERAKDGNVGAWDWSKIMVRTAGDLMDGIQGLKHIPEEALDYTEAELDELYNAFLDELGWKPSHDTGEKFQIFFEGLRDLYLKGLRFKNTLHPPKAEIAP